MVTPMNAEAITRALGGKWSGRSGLAFCPAHDNTRTPALSLADGEDGKLLVTCHAGCDPVDVLHAINGRGFGTVDVYARPLPKPARDNKDRQAFALKLWGEGYPIRDTVAEKYLGNRAIRAPFPKTLRFHPAIRHAETRLPYPGMIGIVTIGDDADQVGIHRTFLTPDGRKAMVLPNKMMLGVCGGGAVRLQDEGTGPLVVCEGIETGLSLRDDLGTMHSAPRVWAALSTSGIKKLVLPSRGGRLVIAPDGDSAGRRAADDLAMRAQALGWQVSIMDAPEGRDWNDVARDPLREVAP